MGAGNVLIKRIFLFEGMLISMTGAIAGLLLGGLLCWVQQEFGLLRLGDGEGIYIIDTYPVLIKPEDFLYVFLTVFVIGYFAAWLPVKKISGRFFRQRLA